MSKEKITRRKFVAGTTGAALGAMIAPRHVLGGAGYYAPSDTVNFALIGCGGQGKPDAAELVVNGQNLVAMADVDFGYVDREIAARAKVRELRLPPDMVVSEQMLAQLKANQAQQAKDMTVLQGAYNKAKRYADFRKLLEAQKDIEFFGPYPFSVPAAHERWKAVSAALGVRQSGYFGLTAQQMKKLLDRNGLSSPSMHIDMNTLRARMNETAEAAHALGQRYVCLPSIPAEERKNLDAYKRIADEFNEIGARAAKAGLRFAYHNHGYGLAEMEGRIPFQVLLERTDPKLVDLQMDIYWTAAGGADPIALLKTYPGRFRLMHIKDMTKRVRFAGDGGDAQQWMALFPFIADAGSGVLDLPAILAQAQKSGAQHFLVERDLTPNPVETLKNSYQYLAAMEFK